MKIPKVYKTGPKHHTRYWGEVVVENFLQTTDGSVLGYYYHGYGRCNIVFFKSARQLWRFVLRKDVKCLKKS